SPTSASTSTSTTTTDTSTSTGSATTNSGSTSSNVIKVNNASGSYVPLVAVQSDGSVATIKNRALGNNTSWITDQTKEINGETYYRVATNEWVAASYLSGNNSAASEGSSETSGKGV